MPNIEGQFRVSSTKGYYEDSNPTGAFELGDELGTVEGYSGSGSYKGYKMKINANRHNSIYGKSNHVIPSNLSIRIWQRIS